MGEVKISPLNLEEFMRNKMKPILLTIFAVVALGVIAYAEVTVASKGTQQGSAQVINFDNRAGINWSYDGFNLGIHGVNWADLHALATTYGDHSGINWQAIPTS
jgi:hypothetical protein